MSCEFCAKNLARLRCLNCPKPMNLCDACFALNHQAESRKDHKYEIISTISIQTILYDLCTKHKTLPCIYFCLDCQLLLCPECVINEGHLSHKKINYQNEISNAHVNLSEITQTEKDTISVLESTGKIITSFQSEIISYFEKLHLLIEEQKKEILKKIENFDEPNFLNFKKLLKQIQKCKEEIESKLKTIEEYEKKYPLSQKNNLNNIYEEIQKLPKFENSILIHKKAISFVLDKKIQAPELSVEDFKEFLSKLLKLNQKNLNENVLDKIILWKNGTEFLQNPISKSLEFKEGAWGNIKQIYPSAVTFLYDPLTSYWYYMSGFKNSMAGYKYNNIEDIFNDRNYSTFSSNLGIDGTYSFVNNGCLFHSVHNSASISKTSLSSFQSIEQLNLENIKIGNTAPMNCQYQTDVCLFNDEQRNCQYVMFESQNKSNATISELVCFPNLKLGKSWEMTIAKSEIGFAFVFDNILFIGSSSKAPIITHIFNFDCGAISKIKEIRFNYEYPSIFYTHFIPSLSTFIVAGPNGVKRLNAVPNQLK